ncbi:DSBA-like thioredoxin domain-containing protein [Desulfopila aestuarii DSM 18488]|uniref:DSBA-like thioredoxin domain-containing protein n=1 Tax=Desulfopila aestuarii DSM 18488 TaxID=1121416 RepID=A0A1M7YGJ1_9BACT|nr:DSBA-like thioredoxin domain-containing protein [Desulfopila aestuarii DSM 18488]
MLLTDLFRADASRIEQIVAGLQANADQLGLPFGPRSRTYNSRLAQELGLWAEEKGCGHSFHMAAFHAYFADGKNLAQEPVLLDLAKTAGLSPDEAKTVLASRSYREQVDRDWQEAYRLQITAVPTFVLGDSRLVGAQSYAALAGLMLQHGVKKQ